MAAPAVVRFGIAGMDHWYAGFAALRGIAAHDGAVVTAAAHRKTAYLEAIARDYDIPYTTDDYHAIVRRDDVDAVVAACTTAEAPALCEEAARHGKHIICVKPMALTLDAADGVVAAVERAGVGFYPLEAIQTSGSAAQQYAKWLQEGRIGRPISATVIRRGGLPTQEWPGVHVARTWWLDASQAPGGGWIDHAIYDVHMLRRLLGAEVVRVTGATANLVHKDIPFEDFGVATITFDNGVVATLEVTWSSGPESGMHAFHLVGTEGQIATDGISGKLAVRGNFAPWQGWVLSDSSRSPSGDSVSLMADFVRNGTPLPATVEDGRQNLAVCLAFYEAARDDRVVALP
ncbi:MAG: Gfo/Idh/MocA family oxidoreductase [Chloroflexota bacterium]|nr:Gfo/Idh/MocA family oxidoreductase [Chloroflexota bacterium]MDE2840132.1 Gfo/Idh/MocA family oxidoreductase [Chloroflexota bacterium]MDE2929534.1 Gfo/Idh/MocA family oxidoreductase [Chloroflexota bacterium]